jgi:hypothetical protein
LNGAGVPGVCSSRQNLQSHTARIMISTMLVLTNAML